MDKRQTIEQEIVSTIIVDQVCLNDERTNTLSTEMFFDSALAEVFKSVMNVRDESKPVDLITVMGDLKARKQLEKIGGVTFLSQLLKHSVLYDHYQDRVLVLHELHLRSKLLSVSVRMHELAMDESNDIFNAIAKSVALIDEVNSTTDIRKERDKREVILEVLEDIQKTKQTGFSGVPSGIYEVDDRVGGFEKGGTTIVAGRPGSGKTAFAISFMTQMVMKNKLNGVLFSLEMSEKSIWKRFLAIDGDISSRSIWRGEIESTQFNKITASAERLTNGSITILDKYFSLPEIISKCRAMNLKRKLDFVVIDYLQLISTNDSKGNREQEVSRISRTLKRLAMELDIPVVALSQLSRAVETRGGDKRPTLSDLRESGSLEQDASTVLFTYRPSYYGFKGENGEDLDDQAFLIMGKHRNGSLRDIQLHYRHDHNQEWCSMSQAIKTGNEIPNNSNLQPNTAF